MRSVTVTVIGAGPAGLAATEAALNHGASVTLLDSGAAIGGQFWRHPSTGLRTDVSLQHSWSRFTALRELIMNHPRCRVITEAQVWSIDHDNADAPRVHARIGPADGDDRAAESFTAEALILATGAHDYTLPFPGWDLPGVFTGGAAQALAKAEQVAVGRKVVVAGAGPFLLPVATSVTAVGGQVLGVYEASRIPRLASGWLPHSPWLVGKGPEFAGYIARLARHRIPYKPGYAVTRAYGDGAVEGVTVSRIDPDWRPISGSQIDLAADAVCVTHGFTTRLELAIAAGCRITADRRVEVDPGQRTSRPDVYAAGEATGIGGADEALVEGRIAGHLAAGGGFDDPEIARSLTGRRRLDHLRRSVDGAHAVGRGWTDWLTEDTVICRCEEVRYGSLRRILDDTQTRGLRSLKLTSRAGLGPCQGRLCGRVLTEIATDGGRRPLTDAVQIDRRPIAAPIRFSELAEDDTSADPGDKPIL